MKDSRSAGNPFDSAEPRSPRTGTAIARGSILLSIYDRISHYCICSGNRVWSDVRWLAAGLVLLAGGKAIRSSLHYYGQLVRKNGKPYGHVGDPFRIKWAGDDDVSANFLEVDFR